MSDALCLSLLLPLCVSLRNQQHNTQMTPTVQSSLSLSLFSLFFLFFRFSSLVLSYRGKFGQVFKLVERATKKVWAGKFIKSLSVTAKDNVRMEIDIMNSLHHPKLVQCVDAFESKSDMVMVLEL